MVKKDKKTINHDLKIVEETAVSMRLATEIPIVSAEADELRKALDVVQKYEKLVDKKFRALFGHPLKDVSLEGAAQISYSVKNDRVIVEVIVGGFG